VALPQGPIYPTHPDKNGQTARPRLKAGAKRRENRNRIVPASEPGPILAARKEADGRAMLIQ